MVSLMLAEVQTGTDTIKEQSGCIYCSYLREID